MTKTYVQAGDIAPGVLASGGVAQDTRTIVFTFDGGGSALDANTKADVIMPVAGTITDWTLLADVSGSIQIDLWRDSYSNYPPTDADSITASAPPAITSATKATSSTLTGWSTSFAAGDIIRANIDSATSITRVVLSLHYSTPVGAAAAASRVYAYLNFR